MSDIWFCCKKTDKVVELSDCLECKEPKNCLSLASYQQGRADAIEWMIKGIEYCEHCGMGKQKTIEHLKGAWANQLKENSNEYSNQNIVRDNCTEFN